MSSSFSSAVTCAEGRLGTPRGSVEGRPEFCDTAFRPKEPARLEARPLRQGEAGCQAVFPVCDYDLAATLSSGQAFRWAQAAGGWEGVIGRRWVRIDVIPPAGFEERPAAARRKILKATALEPQTNWDWLTDYLQPHVDLADVLATFPQDEPMRAAVRACHGLRLLRQEPWECLASFICSSTKQIRQIQQILARLCERFGEPVAVPPGHSPAFSFPTAARLAACAEAELRACKMGFRAPYLLATARKVAAGEVRLEELRGRACAQARLELLKLPGVGRKIADCVLLFALGFQEAFPMDVWVRRALREMYFPQRRVTPRQLEAFAATHFGPFAGYAQQYLFHYRRVQARLSA